MPLSAQNFDQWIGRSQTASDVIQPDPARRLFATFDDADAKALMGDALPLGWQWLYFLDATPQSRIGVDGHPLRGDFLPPIDLPRRMFVGSDMELLSPLRIGESATRISTIKSIAFKPGKSGPLGFVAIAHEFHQSGHLALRETQHLVYRGPEMGGGNTAPKPDEGFAPLWTRTVRPDPVLLFRFSALTFNSHRIHYDFPYATEQEGYPGLVVHGPLTALLLLDLMRREGGVSPTHFSCRAQAPQFADNDFTIAAERTSEGFQLRAIRADGAIAMKAEASAG